MAKKTPAPRPFEIPSPEKEQEVERPFEPDRPLLPKEDDPGIIPQEGPFESPPYEAPPPGEGL